MDGWPKHPSAAVAEGPFGTCGRAPLVHAAPKRGVFVPAADHSRCGFPCPVIWDISYVLWLGKDPCCHLTLRVESNGGSLELDSMVHCSAAGSVPIPGYLSLDATGFVGGDIHPYAEGCTAAASSLNACARRCAATPFCKVFVFAALESSKCAGGCWLRTAAALEAPPITQVLRNHSGPEDSTVTTGIMPGGASFLLQGHPVCCTPNQLCVWKLGTTRGFLLDLH